MVWGSSPQLGKVDNVPEWLTGRPAKALLFERQSSNLCVVGGSSSGVERLLCTQKVGSSNLSFSMVGLIAQLVRAWS